MDSSLNFICTYLALLLQLVSVACYTRLLRTSVSPPVESLGSQSRMEEAIHLALKHMTHDSRSITILDSNNFLLLAQTIHLRLTFRQYPFSLFPFFQPGTLPPVVKYRNGTSYNCKWL